MHVWPPVLLFMQTVGLSRRPSNIDTLNRYDAQRGSDYGRGVDGVFAGVRINGANKACSKNCPHCKILDCLSSGISRQAGMSYDRKLVIRSNFEAWFLTKASETLPTKIVVVSMGTNFYSM